MAFENMVKYAVCSYRHLIFKFLVKSRHIRKSMSTITKFNYQPGIAYFKKEDNKEHFSVSLFIEHKPSKLNKNFTFWRRLDSSISNFLSRVDSKVSAQLEKKLKKNSIDFELPEVNSALYKDGEILSDDCLCLTLFEKEGKYELKILDVSYFVIYNAPWVNEITLPKKILTNSVIFPQKFNTSFTDKERSIFTWYRSEKLAAYIKGNVVFLKDWVKVGNNYCYKVQEEDIGHYLKLVCIPQNETLTGPEFTAICQTPVVAARNDYNFIKTHLLTKEKVDDSKIRIVSYNILADTYATTKEAKEIFDYCPSEVLQKDYRYAALSREIADYNADLLCLQEVELSMHERFISSRLEEDGYGISFCSKANEREGTACYYNKNKFNFISSEKYTFGQEVEKNRFLKNIQDYLKQNEEFFTKFSELPHSLQMLVLQSSSRQDQLLVICNVHLFSSPEADLIRLLQAICSFCLYEYTVEKLREIRPQVKITLILCGDFNSTPESSIHTLVMEGSISADDSIWNSGMMKGTRGISYKLPVNMKSVFNDIKYTNYTRTFKGCLDYIYYQSDELKVSKTYPMPDEDVLSANIGLPSFSFPSDHLPLIAELQWKA